MKFNLVIMIISLLVGYFVQSKVIFISALIMFIYRELEANYFKVTYGAFASKMYDESKWTWFTLALFLVWIVYILYRVVDLLFKGV